MAKVKPANKLQRDVLFFAFLMAAWMMMHYGQRDGWIPEPWAGIGLALCSVLLFWLGFWKFLTWLTSRPKGAKVSSEEKHLLVTLYLIIVYSWPGPLSYITVALTFAVCLWLISRKKEA